MPIHSSVLRARPAEAGKIKIGRLSDNVRQAQGGREYRTPERLNHFIITKTVRKGNDDNFVEDTELMENLPKDPDGKIRRIPIVLDSDLIEEVFPTTLACYAGRALHCRGSGSGKATRFEIIGGRQTGKKRDVPCVCSYLTDPGKLVCKPHGTVWCTIHAGDVTRIGVRHSFRTTSWNSIASITAGLELIRTTVGTICGIPLIMAIGPTMVRTKEGGTRTIQVVHIELATKDLMALKRHVVESNRVLHDVAVLAGKPLMLGMARPAGDQESAAEQAAIQEEWHPDRPQEPDDEGEEGDEEPGKDYDSKTGEVFDVPFTEKTTTSAAVPASTTVPASQLGRNQTGYTAAGGEPRGERQREGADHVSKDDKVQGEIQDKPGTERMNPAGTPSPVAGATTLSKETITSSVGFDEVLPADDPLRPRIGQLLKELAALRGFVDADVQRGMKEILIEITTEACGRKIPFPHMKLGHAMKVVPELERLIVLKRRELEPEDEGETVEESESAEDESDIPT